MEPYIIALGSLTAFFIIVGIIIFTQSPGWLNQNLNKLMDRQWLLRLTVVLYAAYWFLGIFVTLPIVNFILFFLPEWIYHYDEKKEIFYCYKNMPMTGKEFLVVIALFFVGFISDGIVRRLHRIVSSLLLREPVNFGESEATPEE